jgi:Arc/MetJ family transcription regulator
MHFLRAAIAELGEQIPREVVDRALRDLLEDLVRRIARMRERERIREARRPAAMWSATVGRW